MSRSGNGLLRLLARSWLIACLENRQYVLEHWCFLLHRPRSAAAGLVSFCQRSVWFRSAKINCRRSSRHPNASAGAGSSGQVAPFNIVRMRSNFERSPWAAWPERPWYGRRLVSRAGPWRRLLLHPVLRLRLQGGVHDEDAETYPERMESHCGAPLGFRSRSLTSPEPQIVA